MKNAEDILQELFVRYPPLNACEADIRRAYALLFECYRSGGKALIAGNGGSCADSLHIVGELMKSFRFRRSIAAEEKVKLVDLYGEKGAELADLLEGALPAISLPAESALMTAYCNDNATEAVFAQEVYGCGNAGDVFIAISTSGNSPNILLACMAARLKGVRVVGFTGKTGGKLPAYCDAVICVPADQTFAVQEYHLPIYHALCAMLEAAFFGTDEVC